jgi:hypothetical protein
LILANDCNSCSDWHGKIDGTQNRIAVEVHSDVLKLDGEWSRMFAKWASDIAHDITSKRKDTRDRGLRDSEIWPIVEMCKKS